ncbi:MAG: hypothetical protein WDN49_19710 [Acetobacteraceae bacterium]
MRFPNFALASHATIGAFAGFIANVRFGLSVLPSLGCAFLAAGLVGLVSDEFVLRPFRRAGFITTAIGSIALTILLENIVRFVFGNDQNATTCPSSGIGASAWCASGRSRWRTWQSRWR